MGLKSATEEPAALLYDKVCPMLPTVPCRMRPTVLFASTTCEMCVSERALLSTKSRTRDTYTITTTFCVVQHAMHALHACRTHIYRMCSASPELTPSCLCLAGVFSTGCYTLKLP